MLCRTLRLSVDDMGVDGITFSLAALSLPALPSTSTTTTAVNSSPNSEAASTTLRALVTALYHHTSRELATQQLTSHLVSLLGALLLQDASRLRYRSLPFIIFFYVIDHFLVN